MAVKTQQRRHSPDDDDSSILVAHSLPSPSTPTTTTTATTTSERKASATTPPPPPPRRRGTVACRRCRRLRTKCIHGPDCQGPCDACRGAGPQAARECTFPKRGEKDVDRDFRRRPLSSQRLSISSSSSSSVASREQQQQQQQQSLPTSASPADAPLLLSGTATSPLSFPRALATSPQHLPVLPAHLHRRRLLGAGLQLPASPPLHPGAGAVFFPPHDELVEGCRVFVTSCFQLGFLPKAVFLAAVARNAAAVNSFLLAAILGIAARFTPCLARRYGSAARATDNFVRMARAMAPAEMYRPSLDRTQAFFLLAIAGWGNGDRDRCATDMGVAVRMAAILKLHREETYDLPAGAAAAVDEHAVLRSESARRTFWMIHSQENLQAGYSAPAPFSPDDITARLPCDEAAFAYARPCPASARAVLPGTVPARTATTTTENNSNRCLFATLIQSHDLWGRVARRACRADLPQRPPPRHPPWAPGSDYRAQTGALRRFEAALPPRHRWSRAALRAWRADGLHLAFLAHAMVLRVSNIVERRIYLDEMLLLAAGGEGGSHSFWRAAADELFANVAELYEQVEALGELDGEGVPAILVFCVYICGSLASYLWRYPRLCAPRAAAAEAMALGSLRVLGRLRAAWPTSARWYEGLRQIACRAGAAGVAVSVSSGGGLSPTSCDGSDRGVARQQQQQQPQQQYVVSSDDLLDMDVDPSTLMAAGLKDDECAIDPRLTNTPPPCDENDNDDDDAFSNGLFEAEMSTILSNDADFAWLDFERGGG